MSTTPLPLPVVLSDKADMAVEALSVKDREKVVTNFMRFQSEEHTNWISNHTHKVAVSNKGSLWTLRVDQSLRILYCIEHDAVGRPYVLILDVARKERLERLIQSLGANP